MIVPVPRVGVTGPTGWWSPGWWCTALAVHRAGGKALRLTPDSGPPRERLDAIVIGGGSDISPALYQGLEDSDRRLDPDRDEFELRMLEAALARHMPVLGICRGAQLLNVAYGGSLHQDIRLRRRHPPYRATLRARRPVTIRQGSRLAAFVGARRIRVNSLHRQAVSRVGNGLLVVARDTDHVAQAIETSGPGWVLGVQWHPEYLLYRREQSRLFAALVAACL